MSGGLTISALRIRDSSINDSLATTSFTYLGSTSISYKLPTAISEGFLSTDPNGTLSWNTNSSAQFGVQANLAANQLLVINAGNISSSRIGIGFDEASPTITSDLRIANNTFRLTNAIDAVTPATFLQITSATAMTIGSSNTTVKIGLTGFANGTQVVGVDANGNMQPYVLSTTYTNNSVVRRGANNTTAVVFGALESSTFTASGLITASAGLTVTSGALTAGTVNATTLTISGAFAANTLSTAGVSSLNLESGQSGFTTSTVSIRPIVTNAFASLLLYQQGSAANGGFSLVSDGLLETNAGLRPTVATLSLGAATAANQWATVHSRGWSLYDNTGANAIALSHGGAGIFQTNASIRPSAATLTLGGTAAANQWLNVYSRGVTIYTSAGASGATLTRTAEGLVSDTRFIPSMNGTLGIGTVDVRWANGYINSMNVASLNISGLPASRILQLDGNKNVFSSNTLPNNSFATALTITDPIIATSASPRYLQYGVNNIRFRAGGDPTIFAGVCLSYFNTLHMMMRADSNGFSIGYSNTDTATDPLEFYGNTPTAATKVLDINTTGQIQALNGTAGAPSYSFTNFKTAGLYAAAADDIRLSTSGVDRIRITTSNTIISSHFYPVANNTYDLGVNLLRWRNAHFTNTYTNGTARITGSNLTEKFYVANNSNVNVLLVNTSTNTVEINGELAIPELTNTGPSFVTTDAAKRLLASAYSSLFPYCVAQYYATPLNISNRSYATLSSINPGINTQVNIDSTGTANANPVSVFTIVAASDNSLFDIVTGIGPRYIGPANPNIKFHVSLSVAIGNSGTIDGIFRMALGVNNTLQLTAQQEVGINASIIVHNATTEFITPGGITNNLAFSLYLTVIGVVARGFYINNITFVIRGIPFAV